MGFFLFLRVSALLWDVVFKDVVLRVVVEEVDAVLVLGVEVEVVDLVVVVDVVVLPLGVDMPAKEYINVLYCTYLNAH